MDRLKTLLIYDDIQKDYKKHLINSNIYMPKFEIDNKYNSEALILIYLYSKLGLKVTKEELNKFLKEKGTTFNDELIKKLINSGWYITYDNNEYQLVSTKKTNPNF